MQLMFENPVYLWYLASIPLLVMTHFLSLRAAKRKAMQFANFQTLKRVTGKRLVTKNILVLILRIIALSMLILAASGLRVWYLADQAENNYVIAIDVSSSMTAKDFDPNRLDIAKVYAKKFVDNLPSTSKVGIITFSGVSIVEQILSDDHIAAKSAIENIGVTKTGGTDISSALITGTNLLLAEPEKGHVIILFTDGSSTLGNYIDDSMNSAVDYLIEQQVVVHSIGIGSESGPIGYLPEWYNISAIYDAPNLVFISNQTQGMMIPASNDQDLEEAYIELLNQAEQGLVDFRLDLGLLMVGILLLFVEWGLINTRYRRIA